MDIRKIITFILALMVAAFAVGPGAAKTCRRYATKMTETIEKKKIVCDFKSRKKVYSCKEKSDKKLISAYYFSNKKDFVQQNRIIGLQKVKKVRLASDEWVNLEYDKKGRLKAAIMTTMQFYYNKWDDQGRNTAGEATAAGQCRKMALEIVYDDKTRTESHRYTGGEAIKEKGCDFFNGLISDTVYDKDGNVIKTKSTTNGAVISTENFKIEKTKQICVK